MEFYIFFFMALFLIIGVNAQDEFVYKALNPLQPFNFDAPTNNLNQQAIESEKKYVNSGHSIMLTCDLPNSMPDGKVLFIKYDNRPSASTSQLDIREDTDDERYEISQQYAWEWSLKINSISEEDSAIYVCKVGDVLIKKFELIVRIPPRIREDPSQNQKVYKEGSTIEFVCPATGTPRPNINWFVYDQFENRLKEIKQINSNTLRIENVTRNTPRYYQCRASNNIPPSDTRNLTFSIEFAPEIEIQAKYDQVYNKMNLNCTISAYPLTNRNFWRKDGNHVYESDKYRISNHQINHYTYVSIMSINDFDDRKDNGLYECTAENDLKVSKMVYNLNKQFELESKLIPIGSSSSSSSQNNSQNKTNSNKINNKNNRKNKLNVTLSTKKNNKQSINIDSIDSVSINNLYVNNENEASVNNNNNKQSKKSKAHRLSLTTKEIEESKQASPYIILTDTDSRKEERLSAPSTMQPAQESLFILNKSISLNKSSLLFYPILCVLSFVVVLIR